MDKKEAKKELIIRLITFIIAIIMFVLIINSGIQAFTYRFANPSYTTTELMIESFESGKSITVLIEAIIGFVALKIAGRKP